MIVNQEWRGESRSRKGGKSSGMDRRQMEKWWQVSDCGLKWFKYILEWCQISDLDFPGAAQKIPYLTGAESQATKQLIIINMMWMIDCWLMPMSWLENTIWKIQFDWVIKPAFKYRPAALGQNWCLLKLKDPCNRKSSLFLHAVPSKFTPCPSSLYPWWKKSFFLRFPPCGLLVTSQYHIWYPRSACFSKL